MTVLKWIGAILVFAGCGFFGFKTAGAYLAEERMLRKLIGVLDFMSCELQYKLTPLPDLCRQSAGETSGTLQKLLFVFADELESQVSPNVKSCMNAAISKFALLPELTKKCLYQLGQSMGRFDLSGQIQALESVRISCRHYLSKLEAGKDLRLRSYQTLGLCAGAALVILFM